MRRVLGAAAVLMVAAGVFALVGNHRAEARPDILDDFVVTYPGAAGSPLDSCSTCHTSPPNLNAYGLALRDAGFSFSAVESLDSDGDGFTNLEEITALTLPGDATDFPTTPTTTSTTSTTTSTTSTTTTTTTTTMPGAEPLVPPAPPAVPDATPPAEGEPFEAGPAGTVWLMVEGDRIIVTLVDSDWSFEIEEEFEDGEHEVEVEFHRDDVEVEFEAELEDGDLKIEVEIEVDHDGDEARHEDDHDHDDDDDHDDDRDNDDEDDDDHDEDDDD